MSDMGNHPTEARQAVLHRMAMQKHVCPYGLKAKDLLKRAGYEVEFIAQNEYPIRGTA